MRRVNIFLDKLKAIISSEKGKNFFLYALFVMISFVFWLLLTLNNEVQKDYSVRLSLKSVPDSVMILSDLPSEIRVSVKDKGSSLLRYSLGDSPSININFNDFRDSEGNIIISALELRTLVANSFGSGVTILSINPEMIKSKFTTLPPKKVPVIVDASVQPNLQFVISGSVVPAIDSVLVYGDRGSLDKINEVYTYHFEERNLKDTLRREVKISPIPSVKIVPSKIDVIIPIEPLITKQLSIPVVSRGVPYGLDIVTFPSKVNISYLVPASEYKMSQDFVAEVYYGDVLSKTNKLKLYLNHTDWRYGDISLGMDSVEYIIEKK